MDETKGISGTFDLYGLGDGSKLFADYVAPSDFAQALTQSAGASARTGEYWKPAPQTADPAVMENFRAMILGIE